MSILFTTERTLGRRLQPEDEPALLRLYSDPEVGKTLGGTRSPEQVRVRVERFLDHWQQHGFGLWLFHLQESGRFVGYTGLQKVRLDLPDGSLEGVELLYASLPEHWGSGLITETSKAVIEHAFEVLALPELLCFTMTTNLASRRVMEKNGFLYELDFVRLDLPHVLYRLRP